MSLLDRYSDFVQERGKKTKVASVSTFNKIKLMFLFKTLNATSAPEEGVPVASMTISKS